MNILYECDDCKHKFMVTFERDVFIKKVECPKCKKRQAVMIISVINKNSDFFDYADVVSNSIDWIEGEEINTGELWSRRE